MKQTNKLLLVIFSFMMIGIGGALTLKTAIGVGAWDALGQTGYDLLHIKAGTVSMVLNCSCVIGQILILRKNFRLIQILQIPCSIVLGYVTNFVLYDLLGNIILPNYIIRLVVFVFAIIWNAFFVSMIMCLNVVTTGLEGFCDALTLVIHKPMSVIRQWVDIIAMSVIVVVSLLFHIPLSIGVGTVIAMIIFGPSLGFFIKKLEKYLG